MVGTVGMVNRVSVQAGRGLTDLAHSPTAGLADLAPLLGITPDKMGATRLQLSLVGLAVCHGNLAKVVVRHRLWAQMERAVRAGFMCMSFSRIFTYRQVMDNKEPMERQVMAGLAAVAREVHPF